MCFTWLASFHLSWGVKQQVVLQQRFDHIMPLQERLNRRLASCLSPFRLVNITLFKDGSPEKDAPLSQCQRAHTSDKRKERWIIQKTRLQLNSGVWAQTGLIFRKCKARGSTRHIFMLWMDSKALSKYISFRMSQILLIGVFTGGFYIQTEVYWVLEKTWWWHERKGLRVTRDTVWWTCSVAPVYPPIHPTVCAMFTVVLLWNNNRPQVWCVVIQQAQINTGICNKLSDYQRNQLKKWRS